jgi:hypothetical protein
MAGGQLTLSQAHLEDGAWTNCFPYHLCQLALAILAACVAVGIAVLTRFGIEAKGIRFVPNEVAPRVAQLEECTR